MSERRWSSHVHVRHGGLAGWCEHCPAEARHDALRRAAEHDGWGTVVRRLNFLANVHSRSNNPELGRIARADEHWAEEHEHRRRGGRRE